MAGKTRNYTDEFLKWIVALKQSGKSTTEISNEYKIAKSTIIVMCLSLSVSSFAMFI